MTENRIRPDEPLVVCIYTTGAVELLLDAQRPAPGLEEEEVTPARCA